MGWLRNAEQANEELDIPMDIANEAFGSNMKLTARHIALLGRSESTRDRAQAA
jgi:hypothetical protein